MKTFLFLLPACLMVLAGCSGKQTYDSIKVPEIERFEILRDGTMLFYGKNVQSLKELDLTFEFTIGQHDYLGKTHFIGSGKSAVVTNDSTLTISPSKVEKIELMNIDSVSPEVHKFIEKTSKGSGATRAMIATEDFGAFLAHLGSVPGDYTLWLTLKDMERQFWRPENKEETTFKIGFYQLLRMSRGNFFPNNATTLEWMPLAKK